MANDPGSAGWIRWREAGGQIPVLVRARGRVPRA